MVSLVEPLRDLLDERLLEGVAGRDRERVLLRLVPHVQRVLHGGRLRRHALVCERRAALGLERAEDVRERREVRRGGLGVERAAEVAAEIGLEHAPRRERAGEAGHDDDVDLELLGEEGRVHRAGAAERDEREVTRLDPLGHGQRPDRLRHLRVDHVEDPFRELERLERELRARVRRRRVRAAAVSSDSRPPANDVGSIRPSTRFASVTVGSLPPRP